jgi:flagella basal body P-ring formation protein FlgA
MLFCALLLMSVYSAEAQTKVILKKSTIVPGPVVTIGEIADISGGTVDIINKIKQINLTPAPQPKIPIKITAELVRYMIKQNRIQETDALIGGGGFVMVYIDTVVITGEQIIEVARKYLDEKVQIPDGTKIITPVRPVSTVIAPKRDCFIKVMPNIIGRLKGVVSISVGIYNGDRFYQMLPVQMQVRTFEPMVVTLRTIQYKTILVASDIKRIIGESTQYNNDLVTDVSQVIGQETKRTISAEQPILQSDLLPPTLVRQGDLVEIEVTKGGVTIWGTGIARRDGRLGDTIPVARANQSVVIQALVAGDKKVIIK